MKGALGWGQRLGSVSQIAHVVADLDLAIAQFINDHGAGPFFVIDHFLAPGQTYRGQESRADVRIAMGFSGQTWFELIQPLDDHPSVYRETVQSRGYGPHHYGIAFTDCEAALTDYCSRGWSEVFRAAVPTGGEVIYLEKPGEPLFLELLPYNDGMDSLFTSFWQAAQGWDGKEPVRAFI
jgi:hypothetical protein